MAANAIYNHNPDVLSCLANLSSDEVFTPPDIVNQMLDLLPQDLFRDKNTRFLDPFTKSGVFLREIAKRLIAGLEEEIPELQARIDHIFKNQLFGIAITELTSLLSRRSLYCTKYPNSPYSVSAFDDIEGNIRFKAIPHTWDNGKCVFCGASQQEYDREEGLESHAYEFIHTVHPERIYNMKFDVIIGNPPYQMSDGGGTGSSAKPIYQLFVSQAKLLNPRYISFIIPARWYSGGKGLNQFRKEMLNDRRIKTLVDFENFRDVFPGVDLAGGACYFLWDRDYEGKCNVVNFVQNNPYALRRDLDEFPIFIRSNRALEIVRKVVEAHKDNQYLDSIVSSRLPFGITSKYVPAKSGIVCHYTQRIGKSFAREEDVVDKYELLGKWKLLVPKAPIAGQTDFSQPIRFYYDGNVRIAQPGECCSESWLVAGAFKTKEEAMSYKTYLFTKTVRFLLLQTVVSQNITKKNYRFIPHLGEYVGVYTDEDLCSRWGINQDEWKVINSKILDTEVGVNNE